MKLLEKLKRRNFQLSEAAIPSNVVSQMKIEIDKVLSDLKKKEPKIKNFQDLKQYYIDNGIKSNNMSMRVRWDLYHAVPYDVKKEIYKDHLELGGTVTFNDNHIDTMLKKITGLK